MATAKVCPKYIEAFNNNEVYIARQLAIKYPQFSLSPPSTPTTSSDDAIHCLRAARLSAISPTDFAEKLFNATSNLLAPTNMSFNCSFKDDESQIGDNLNQSITEAENETIIPNDKVENVPDLNASNFSGFSFKPSTDLSEGILALIHEKIKKHIEPVLQVTNIKFTKKTPHNQYRVLLNDGLYSKYHGVIHSNTLSTLNTNCIIKITKHKTEILDTENGPTLMINILSMKVLESGNNIGKVIGNPQEIQYEIKSHSLNNGPIKRTHIADLTSETIIQ